MNSESLLRDSLAECNAVSGGCVLPRTLSEDEAGETMNTKAYARSLGWRENEHGYWYGPDFSHSQGGVHVDNLGRALSRDSNFPKTPPCEPPSGEFRHGDIIRPFANITIEDCQKAFDNAVRDHAVNDDTQEDHTPRDPVDWSLSIILAFFVTVLVFWGFITFA